MIFKKKHYRCWCSADALASRAVRTRACILIQESLSPGHVLLPRCLRGALLCLDSGHCPNGWVAVERLDVLLICSDLFIVFLPLLRLTRIARGSQVVQRPKDQYDR